MGWSSIACVAAKAAKRLLHLRVVFPLDHGVIVKQLGLGSNMDSKQIAVVASVMATLRGDLTASCVADRFGVTEASVNEWKDVFISAGVLAVAESLNGMTPRRHAASKVCDVGG